MNNLRIKKVVCLESEEEIARLREEQRRHERFSSGYGLLREPLWREIVVYATSEHIEVNLGNVEEEGALRGTAGVRYCCRRFKITWPDLADTDGLEQLLRFEVLVVARKVLEVLTHLREMAPKAHEMLSV